MYFVLFCKWKQNDSLTIDKTTKDRVPSGRMSSLQFLFQFNIERASRNISSMVGLPTFRMSRWFSFTFLETPFLHETFHHEMLCGRMLLQETRTYLLLNKEPMYQIYIHTPSYLKFTVPSFLTAIWMFPLIQLLNQWLIYIHLVFHLVEA